jgi:hypothetical protein
MLDEHTILGFFLISAIAIGGFAVGFKAGRPSPSSLAHHELAITRRTTTICSLMCEGRGKPGEPHSTWVRMELDGERRLHCICESGVEAGILPSTY